MDALKAICFTLTLLAVLVTIVPAEHHHKDHGNHHGEHGHHHKDHGHHHGEHGQHHKHDKDHKHHHKSHDVEEVNCATYFKGCKLSQGKCVCGEAKGCKNTYPYKDLHECEQDLRGENDPCTNHKCKHDGLCVQTKLDDSRSYRCDCTATGYYGKHCQHKCEEKEAGQEDYPAECIEIF